MRDRTINAADGGWVEPEWGIIFKVMRGPRESECNFQLVKAASREMFWNSNHKFPLLRYYIYPRICTSRYPQRRPF